MHARLSLLGRNIAPSFYGVQCRASIKVMPAFEHFEIDIGRALIEQMYEIIRGLTPASLSPGALSALPDGMGVYQLYHQGQMVYIGKADRDLRKRLDQHRFKIEGRQNIKIEDMSFTCLFLHENWNPLVHESGLISSAEKATGIPLDWNGNGFGNHDPGREREETQKGPDGFDARFSIDTAWRPLIRAGDWTVDALLVELKRQLPFLLRYQTARKGAREPHPDYKDVKIRVPKADMPVDLLMSLIAARIPGWQATAFPSHIIFYDEARAYTYGKMLRLKVRRLKRIPLSPPSFVSSIHP